MHCKKEFEKNEPWFADAWMNVCEECLDKGKGRGWVPSISEVFKEKDEA